MTGELERDVVRKFFAAEAVVAVIYLHEADTRNFRKEFPQALQIQGNQSNEDYVRRIFATVIQTNGAVDILCNFAGGFMPK